MSARSTPRTVPARDVGPLRLAAQGLIGPAAGDPADAVRRLLAAQAQDLPGAVTAVALRTAGRTHATVRAALDDGRVVRSWPMRGTLHFTAAEDLGWLQALTTDRLIAGAARRRAALALDDAALDRARDLALAALAGGRRLRRDALYAAWNDGGVDTGGQRGYHLLWHTAQTGAVVFGPTDGREQAIVRADEWITAPRAPAHPLAELALRFFTGHGPATDADLARWVGLPLRDVRTGLAEVADRLDAVTVDGRVHYLDPAVPDLLADHRRAAGAVLLLPGFDEFVLGYADRGAVLPAEYAQLIVPGNNGMFRATVVAGGQVVGVWGHGGRKSARTVAATPFTTFSADRERRITAAYGALPTD
ncbi:hypothetical protein GCM10010123_43310 [Pilimelia anulata]|uniref:Winged helix DNA-binding domain-containing protein n=1 Tax=Pilimelia anulata TaxID=53371 RepID=A0A8J3FGC3_9ACTN|nr:winged helix DNA-binding domain-containing protein [Pilimelia anulata]GGK08789.1 hypothetical protein GCM10010123_43310 [Pilimelia anulata]